MHQQSEEKGAGPSSAAAASSSLPSRRYNLPSTGTSSYAGPTGSSVSAGAAPAGVAAASSSNAAAGGGLAGLAAVEARLAGQVSQAAAQHEAHQAALRAGLAPLAPALPTLPLSSASAPLRPVSLAASMAGQGAAAQAPPDLHALEWADQQFKRAGVHALPAVDRSHAHAVPIQNLGMQQRLRHAQLFSVVERLREGQQHIFLEQFNQFPNVERHTADDYSRIWHSFKNKDEEAEHIITKLNGVCDNIDALNRHANHSHS